MENLMDFNSPTKIEAENENEMNSPGSNPFDSALKTAEAFTHSAGKESFPFNDIDFDCGRESLGILHIDLEKLNYDDTNWSNVPDIQVDRIFLPTPEDSSNSLNTAFLYSYNRNNKLSIASSTSPLSSCPDSLISLELSRIPSPNSLLNSDFNTVSTLNKGFLNSETDNNIKTNDTIFIKDKVFKLRPRIHSLPNMISNEDIEINLKNLQNAEYFSDIKTTRLVNEAVFKRFRKSESLLKKSFAIQNLKVKHIDDEEFNDSVFIEGKQFALKLADESILEVDEGEFYNLDCTPQPDLMEISYDTEEKLTRTEEIFKNVDKMIPSQNMSGTIRKSTDKLNENEQKDEECQQNISEIFSAEVCNKLSTSRLSHDSNNSRSRDAKSILHNLSEILNSDNPSAQQKTEGWNLLYSLADILCPNDTKESENDKNQSEDSGHSSIDQESQDNKELGSFDALDLRINIKGTDQIPDKTEKPLDLSVSKLKKLNTSNILHTSVSKADISTKNVVRTLANNSSVNKSKNESVNSNDSGKSINTMKMNISELSSLGKLKPKKVDKKIMPEKGPLKAMIPVGNMSKVKGVSRISKIGTTPPKSSQYGLFKNKRTSTPKTESKLQPVAQSTPESSCPDTRKFTLSSSYLRQRKSEHTPSPLARKNSIGGDNTEELNKKNRSGSAPNLSSSSITNSFNSGPGMFRRRSASDLKLSKDGSKLKRSKTIDKDSGIATTLSRVRENIEKTRNSMIENSQNKKPLQYKGILGEKNRYSNSSNIKPCNLANKLKRSTGSKENVRS